MAPFEDPAGEVRLVEGFLAYDARVINAPSVKARETIEAIQKAAKEIEAARSVYAETVSDARTECLKVVRAATDIYEGKVREILSEMSKTL